MESITDLSIFLFACSKVRAWLGNGCAKRPISCAAPAHGLLTLGVSVSYGQNVMSRKHLPVARLVDQCWAKGMVHIQKQEWQAAAAAYDVICRHVPKDVLARLNLARALIRSGQVDQGIEQARLLLEQDPSNVLARQLLGQHFSSVGSHEEAILCLQGLPDEVDPPFDYLQALGVSQLQGHRYHDAIATFFKALEMRLDHAECHYQLGFAFKGLGMRREAIECMKTVLALNVPSLKLACLTQQIFMLRELCEWQDLSSLEAQMCHEIDALKPEDVSWSVVFACISVLDDPIRHLALERACANFYGRGVMPLSAVSLRSMPSRVRIGFVSADFHHHATSMLMVEVLEQLDRSRFEVCLYSHGPDDNTAMRRRVVAAADEFIEIGGMSDQSAAERIRADGTHVLVDLKGYTQDTRMGIFAYRPSPVQVTYLGFPGGTGAHFMDYLIGDPVVTPIEDAEHYLEKLALMPETYQPNDRMRPLPKPVTRRELGLPEDALVLCGFNLPHKLSPEVLDAWADLLKALPQAVLWLLAWIDGIDVTLTRELQARGIDASRVVFAKKMPVADHISRFAVADIYLDTWPYNGHTTASDALWAGVPVVTQSGKSFASRVASSLLGAVGLPELITHSTAEYVEKVKALANAPERRERLKQQLVQARDVAPLFDSTRFAAHFGLLLEEMVRRACSGKDKSHIHLDRDLAA